VRQCNAALECLDRRRAPAEAQQGDTAIVVRAGNGLGEAATARSKAATAPRAAPASWSAFPRWKWASFESGRAAAAARKPPTASSSAAEPPQQQGAIVRAAERSGCAARARSNKPSAAS